MNDTLRNERGVALLLTIFGLIVVGGLITAIFASSLLERRMADTTRRTARAFNTAERGMTYQVAAWGGQWNSLAIGQSAPFNGTLPFATGTYSGSAVRMNNELFWVRVVGQDATSATRSQLGTFIKLIPLAIDVQGAVTTRGAMKIGGSADIQGADTPPGGWGSCGPPGPADAGIRIDDQTGIDGTGQCNNLSCIQGSPDIQEDPSITDNTFFDYGDLDYDALAAYAMQFAPQTFTSINPSYDPGPVCRTSDVYNWGATGTDDITSDPCASLFRIIHVTGNAQIASSSSGQGILLVDGDLKLTGGFEFYGVVIVRGKFETSGQGGHINGGLLAGNVNLDENSVLGNATLNFSTCAIARALGGVQPGAPFRSRGWIQAY